MNQITHHIPQKQNVYIESQKKKGHIYLLRNRCKGNYIFFRDTDKNFISHTEQIVTVLVTKDEVRIGNCIY
jgi:hypothetical protein